MLVGGRWVDRTARRPDAEPGLRRETTLLPWLAPRLPLPVPRPTVVAESPLTVRHELIRGVPATVRTAARGRRLGAFVRALHDVPVAQAVAHGLPGAEITRDRRDRAFARFTAEVAPALPDDRPLRAALDRLDDAPAEVVVHGDLRADHVLVDAGEIAGVIDWGEARAGDPAKDLEWLLLDTAAEVAAAVVEAYGTDLTGRARDWRAVGPCYAWAHGVDTGDAALVAAAIEQLAAASRP